MGWDGANSDILSLDTPGTDELPIYEAKDVGIWWARHELTSPINPSIRVWTSTGTVCIPLEVVNRGSGDISLRSRRIEGPKAVEVQVESLDLDPGAEGVVELMVDTSALKAGSLETLIVEHGEQD